MINILTRFSDDKYLTNLKLHLQFLFCCRPNIKFQVFDVGLTPRSKFLLRKRGNLTQYLNNKTERNERLLALPLWLNLSKRFFWRNPSFPFRKIEGMRNGHSIKPKKQKEWFFGCFVSLIRDIKSEKINQCRFWYENFKLKWELSLSKNIKHDNSCYWTKKHEI